MFERPTQLIENLERYGARFLTNLPGSFQILLSGQAQVHSGKDRLHPEMQLMLALLRYRGFPEIHELPPKVVRKQLIRDTRIHKGPEISVKKVEDIAITHSHGVLQTRHYTPPYANGTQPLLVYLHGGGFMSGNLDTHDTACRFLCREVGIHVLAVDYRLSPECPFPSAVEDAQLAFEWACAHAEDLGVNPNQIAIGGDSAGGNLAAVVSQVALKKGGPTPLLQLLIYPATDRTREYTSLSLFEKGFLLTRKDIDYFLENYARGADLADPRISPLLSPQMTGLPPALVVTAAFDPLRDEGEAFAAALKSAGTPAVLMRVPGLLHGFVNMLDVSQAARHGFAQVADQLRFQLGMWSSRSSSVQTH